MGTSFSGPAKYILFFYVCENVIGKLQVRNSVFFGVGYFFTFNLFLGSLPILWQNFCSICVLFDLLSYEVATLFYPAKKTNFAQQKDPLVKFF